MANVGDRFILTERQIDHDDLDNERYTLPGTEVEITAIHPRPQRPEHYQVACKATGAWWFFTEEELAAQARPLVFLQVTVWQACVLYEALFGDPSVYDCRQHKVAAAARGDTFLKARGDLLPRLETILRDFDKNAPK